MEIYPPLYKKYWEIGFKTRLYDWLSPEAYLESLRRTAKFMELKEGEWALDAGCGSGLLVFFLADRLQQSGRYLGMDILKAGLDSLKLRANCLSLKNPVCRVQSDFLRNLPMCDAKVSCAVAHFSIYTLPEKNDRSQVYQELWRVLKPGGVLVTSNPTGNYDAEQIILSSLELLQNKGKPWLVKKYLLYPITLHLGLNHIEGQLKSGKWHGYGPEELCDEVAQAGFSIEHSESIYGGSGSLVVGRKL